MKRSIRRTRQLNMPKRSLVWLLAPALLVACDSGAPTTQPAAKAPASASTGATKVTAATTAAAAGSVAPAAPASIAPLDLMKVAAPKKGESGPWLAGFEAKRLSGLSLAPAQAQKACGDEDMTLCTEPQWRLACKQESKLGDQASWTVRADGNAGFSLNGGGSRACAGRATVSAPNPGARVCCSRAIAIESSNKNAAFLKITGAKLLAWESALNSGSADEVGALLEDGVSYDGKQLGKRKYVALARSFFKGDPNFSAVFVSCKLSVQQADDTWTALCKALKNVAGKQLSITDRLVWGGRSKKLQSVREVKVTPIVY